MRHPSINLRSISYIDQVPYESSGDWPTEGNNNGPTIELVNPALDNSQGYNWRTAIGDVYDGRVRGTPGYQNSTFNADIGIVIQTTERSVQYPTSTDTIAITANVQVSSSLASAQLFVDTGAGFSPIPLTAPTDPGAYTATVGPYASGTYVRYYVEFTDTSNKTVVYPDNAPTDFEVFLVRHVPVPRRLWQRQWCADSRLG